MRRPERSYDDTYGESLCNVSQELASAIQIPRVIVLQHGVISVRADRDP